MYKRDINETRVLRLAEEIRARGFRHSHLQIDDGWSSHYGDFDFNTDKSVDSRHHWRPQLWGTGARAPPPSTFS